jgi:adenosylhomocysteine nucleosidase
MTGIIGAMEDEVTMLRSAMANTGVQKKENFEFITGDLEGKLVVLLRCGIGKVHAAVGCAFLIDTSQPDLVLKTGSAGGIDPSLSFGDVIVSDGLVYHDVDVTAFNYAPGQLPGEPQIFPAAEDFIRLGERAVDELKREGVLPANLNHQRGLIGSGDVFMHDPKRIEALRRSFPGLRAVEMEGAAIAHVCYMFKTPFLIIRALSDIAGVESPMKSEEYLPLAAKHSAEIVRRIIRIKNQ